MVEGNGINLKPHYAPDGKGGGGGRSQADLKPLTRNEVKALNTKAAARLDVFMKIAARTGNNVFITIGRKGTVPDNKEARGTVDLFDGTFRPRTISELIAQVAKPTPEELRIINDGEKAIDDLTMQFMPLVWSLAEDYAATNSSIPFEDLVQEGSIGLMRAAATYDSSQGSSFITYAYQCITFAILRGNMDKIDFIRLPNYIYILLQTIRHASNELLRDNGIEPTAQDIATKLGMDVEKVEDLLDIESRRHVRSLDTNASPENPETLGDIILDPSYEDAARVAGDIEALKRRMDLANLTERERDILCKLFGLDNNVPHSQAEIAKILHLTRSRVSFLYIQAISKLRKVR